MNNPIENAWLRASPYLIIGPASYLGVEGYIIETRRSFLGSFGMQCPGVVVFRYVNKNGDFMTIDVQVMPDAPLPKPTLERQGCGYGGGGGCGAPVQDNFPQY